MPHKYVTPEVLSRLRDEVARFDSEIARIRSIARKDKEGIENFIARIKKLLVSATAKKNMAMEGMMEASPSYDEKGRHTASVFLESEAQSKMALIFRGEERAFEAVLEMFENSDLAVEILVSERDSVKNQLQEYEKYEQRTEPSTDER